jgi:hypothetical protein
MAGAALAALAPAPASAKKAMKTRMVLVIRFLRGKKRFSRRAQHPAFLCFGDGCRNCGGLYQDSGKWPFDNQTPCSQSANAPGNFY